MQKTITRAVATALVVSSTFALAGCTPPVATTNGANANARTNVNSSGSPGPAPSPTLLASPTPPAVIAPAVDFVDYENRAVGYRIRRPDKWYWRHSIRGEIGDAAPLVDDYFVTDKNPLPELGTEYLGMIVIEVSRRDQTELASGLEGLTQTEAAVGGQSATRYGGVRSNETSSSQTWIEYHFTRNGRLFRFIFSQTDASPADSAVFEEIVRGFTFNP